VAFVASTCRQDRKVTLYYRPGGQTTWFSKEMVMRLGQFSAVVPLPVASIGALDWYVTSAGVYHGSATQPMVLSVR
jgi:hypothetical protein